MRWIGAIAPLHAARTAQRAIPTKDSVQDAPQGGGKDFVIELRLILWESTCHNHVSWLFPGIMLSPGEGL
jgi:hypothetical protein